MVHPRSAAGADPPLQAQILRAKRKMLPALVHIVPVQEFFVGGERRKRLATGSGVIIRRDGYVLTNSHVIGKGEKIICILSDEREVPASVVGTDPYTDVAVLKLDAAVLDGAVSYARFGNSDRLEQGAFVLAMGSPFGLARTVSLGVVSTTRRALGDPAGTFGRFNTWIQTDAAINPGNSGGPLVDLHGRIVGINTRGMAGVAENIGFAVPGNLAREIADKLIADGHVQRSTLHVTFQSIESVRGYPASGNGQRPTGALIASVERTGPAARAGVQPGDILIAIDGAPVDGRFDELIPALQKTLSDLPAEREVLLTVERQGEPLTLRAITAPLDVYFAPEFQAEEWGLTLTQVTAALVAQHRLEDASGVHVASAAPGKAGHTAGLRPGDIVYLLDGEPVRDMEHFRDLYATVAAEQRARVLLEVRNGSFYRFVLVKPKLDADTATDASPDGAEGEADGEPLPPEPDAGPDTDETADHAS